MRIVKPNRIKFWAVKKIVTNLAVLEVTDKGFKLLETAPGVSILEIENATEGTLIIEGEIPEMQF